MAPLWRLFNPTGGVGGLAFHGVQLRSSVKPPMYSSSELLHWQSLETFCSVPIRTDTQLAQTRQLHIELNTNNHHRSYEISHRCVFLIIAASLRLLIVLIPSAETSALESPTLQSGLNSSSSLIRLLLPRAESIALVRELRAIELSVRVPLPLPVYAASLISPIMPLSNIARNCFRQGRVEDMTARCVVIVVVMVTAMLV
jgi:hypothetical protein